MRLTALLIAALSALLLCSPQQAAAGKVIAALMSSDQPRYRDAHRTFVKSMASRGYGASTTEIILQTPNPDPLSWSNTIRKFNAYRPDLIVAYGAPASQVALKEAEGIPVISVDVYGAEQPVRGVAGVSSRVPMITLLKTLQEMRPCRKIGVLYSARELGSLRQLEDIRKYAGQLGMSVVERTIKSAAGIDAALTDLLDKVDTLVLTESGAISRQFERIVGKARARSIPVLATMPDAAEKGALVSLEISPQEQGHLAAEVAARILDGASVAQLSLLTPHRIDLIVNLKTARELGVSVPYTVLGTATRLIK